MNTALKKDALDKNRAEDLELEPELRAAIEDFRLSLDAWSQAAISRPRAAARPKWVWRQALGWALASALLATGISAGAWSYRRHQAAEQARIALEQRRLEVERQLAEQKAREEEEQLLASIDTTVARQVPSAMEPLAELMQDE